MRSEVDATGRRVRLQLADETVALDASAAAMAVLGGKARLTRADVPLERAAAGMDGRWFGAGEVVGLARVEGRLYRLRIVIGAVRDGGLSSADSKVLDDALAAEIATVLAGVEASGDAPGDWFAKAWSGIRAAVVARCKRRLPQERAAAVAEWLNTPQGAKTETSRV